jgi:hypothetical protein
MKARSLTRIGLPVFALGLLLSSRSDAGRFDPRYSFCSADANGQNGLCMGSFLGFRNDSDPDGMVEFSIDNFQRLSFVAKTNKKTYTCYTPTWGQGSDPQMVALWPVAMSARGFFEIEWDKNGNCNMLILANGSDQANY